MVDTKNGLMCSILMLCMTYYYYICTPAYHLPLVLFSGSFCGYMIILLHLYCLCAEKGSECWAAFGLLFIVVLTFLA